MGIRMHKANHNDKLSLYSHHLSLLKKIEQPRTSFFFFEEFHTVLLIHILEKIVRVQKLLVPKANFLITFSRFHLNS